MPSSSKLRVVDRPAVARGVARVVDLAGDGFLFVGDVLVSALTGLDGGDHVGLPLHLGRSVP